MAAQASLCNSPEPSQLAYTNMDVDEDSDFLFRIMLQPGRFKELFAHIRLGQNFY